MHRVQKNLALFITPILGLLIMGQEDCNDYDEDGYTVAQGDCDDDDASVYPDAPESCNLADEDCDTVFDEGYAAGCGIVERQFPTGEYLYQGLWTQSFEDAPYIISYFGWVQSGSSNGTYAGQWSAALWYSQASYQADNTEPDCFIYNHMSNQIHVADSQDDINYDNCPGCEPYSDFSATFWEDLGCSPDALDFWMNHVGYFPTYTQYFGYRDAQTRGWPKEFSIYIDMLEGYGAIGTLYDFMIWDDAFAPHYYVVPASTLTDMHPPSLFKALPHTASGATTPFFDTALTTFE